MSDFTASEVCCAVVAADWDGDDISAKVWAGFVVLGLRVPYGIGREFSEPMDFTNVAEPADALVICARAVANLRAVAASKLERMPPTT